jgi:hypothetical protein
MVIRQVIRAFGGIRPMAVALEHKSHTTVQGWWEREVIPARRQPEVLAAAERLGISVTAADMIPAIRVAA